MRRLWYTVVLVACLLLCVGGVAASSPSPPRGDLSMQERKARSYAFVRRLCVVLQAFAGDEAAAGVFGIKDGGVLRLRTSASRHASSPLADVTRSPMLSMAVSAASLLNNFMVDAFGVMQDKLVLLHRLVTVGLGRQLPLHEEAKMRELLARGVSVNRAALLTQAEQHTSTTARPITMNDHERSAPSASQVHQIVSCANGSCANADVATDAARLRGAYKLDDGQQVDATVQRLKQQIDACDEIGYAALNTQAALMCVVRDADGNYDYRQLSWVEYFTEKLDLRYCDVQWKDSYSYLRCVCPPDMHELANASTLLTVCTGRSILVDFTVDASLRCQRSDETDQYTQPFESDYCFTSRRGDTLQLPYTLSLRWGPVGPSSYDSTQTTRSSYNDNDDDSEYVMPYKSAIRQGTISELQQTPDMFQTCSAIFVSSDPDAVTQVSSSHPAAKYMLTVLPITFDAPELSTEYMIQTPVFQCPGPQSSMTTSDSGVAADVHKMSVQLAKFPDMFARYREIYFEVGVLRNVTSLDINVSRVHVKLIDAVRPPNTYQYSYKVDRMYFIIIAVAVLIVAGIVAQILWQLFMRRGDLEDKLVSYATHVAKTREQKARAATSND